MLLGSTDIIFQRGGVINLVRHKGERRQVTQTKQIGQLATCPVKKIYYFVDSQWSLKLGSFPTEVYFCLTSTVYQRMWGIILN